RGTTLRSANLASGGEVEVHVVYDGEDLADVGHLTGLGERGVVEAHTEQDWKVAFCGFAPGFGYMVGDDDRLNVPRRTSPRTKVPPGAVGLA
ncbi:allophanate hydrolase subunit 1, partial [Klebsiella pneumoniae]|nr:allophanate hydrolase subunit 1 [Klebsiella pneumoniae]